MNTETELSVLEDAAEGLRKDRAMNKKVINQQIDGTIFRSIPHGEEVSYTTLVRGVMEDPPPIPVEQVLAMGYAMLVNKRLQANKGRLRSIRHGWWKREKDVVREEVAHNENVRARKGSGMIINVVKEIRDKAADMPGLAAEIDDDLMAWMELGRDVLGEDDSTTA